MVAAGELGAVRAAAAGCRGDAERREAAGCDGEVGAGKVGLVERRSEADRARPEKVAAAMDRGVRRGEVSTSLRSPLRFSEDRESLASCMLEVGLGRLDERA